MEGGLEAVSVKIAQGVVEGGPHVFTQFIFDDSEECVLWSWVASLFWANNTFRIK